jgi:preprotein translocase subunit YajC
VNIAGLLPILLLGVVFWALLIRPQQKAKASARLMQTALSPGDEVSTVGGIYGIVRDLDTATVDLEISEDVIVRFDRRAVNRIVRDIPAEEGEQYRIGDDEDADHEEPVAEEPVAEAPAAADKPSDATPATDDPSNPVDAPEPAR